MKKNLFLMLIFIMTTSASFSQSGETIGSGNVSENGGISIQWNMNNLISGLMTADGIQLSNGYYEQQSMEQLSIEEPTMVSDIRLYPNPATSEIHITFNSQEIFSESIGVIYDINGRKIKSVLLPTTENIIQISELNSGVYLLVLTSNSKSNTYRFIKK